MLREIMLLRHGRTQYNEQGRLQGQIDVPLDKVGRWQAYTTALTLAQRYAWAHVAQVAQDASLLQRRIPQEPMVPVPHEQYVDSPVAGRKLIIRSSDLSRAYETARATADILGLDVEQDARLREQSYGQFEGMTRQEIEAVSAHAWQSWRDIDVNAQQEYGVETMPMVAERGASVIQDLVDEYGHTSSEVSALLVAHGSLITATVCHLLQWPSSYILHTMGSLINASWISIVPRYEADQRTIAGWQLKEFNGGPAHNNLREWMSGPAWL